MYLYITVSAALLIALDAVWFKFASDFFKNEISTIARISLAGEWSVLLLPAVLVYCAVAVGIVVFVLPRVGGVTDALMFGALFGALLYAVYDLTNLATLSAWTLRFALVDILWGAFLCSVVTTAIYLVSNKL